MIKIEKKVTWLPSIIDKDTLETKEWKACLNWIPDLTKDTEFYVSLSDNDKYKYSLIAFETDVKGNEETSVINYGNDFKNFEEILKCFESKYETLENKKFKTLLVKETTLPFEWIYGVILYDETLYTSKDIQKNLNNIIEMLKTKDDEWNVEELREKFNKDPYNEGCEFFPCSENDSVFA